jgi:hypothetical protein
MKVGHIERRHVRPAVPAASPTGSAADGFVPTDEDRNLLADLTAEVRKRQVSGSENFDKSVLTLSRGGLAFSLGLLKEFLPIGHRLSQRRAG